MQNILDGGKALRQLIGRVGIGHAGDLLELLVRFLHAGVVLQSHHIPVAKVLRLHAFQRGVVIVVLDEVLQGLLPGDKGRLEHIVQGIDLGAHASCLGITQVAVNIDQNLTGLVQVLHHHIQVVGQDGEAAHDQQAGHGDTDSGKGHKAMQEDAPHALLQQVTNIIDSHSRSTPLRH